MKIAQDMSFLIGNTPLVRLNRLTEGCYASVVCKLEFFNPTSSVKDRAAFAMIEDAERQGKIDSETLIIEPTSGNTGIGLAFVCAVRGYRLLLTMPESMSIERRSILSGLGAEIRLSPSSEGMKGAIDLAHEIAEEHANFFIPDQFNNPENPGVHSRTTAEEIWEDTDGEVDYLVSGVGTGGTISGISETIRKRKADFRAIAVEPAGSPFISQGKKGAHRIQGIGAGFIPGNLNREVIDEVVTVTDDEAFETARRLAREEGIFCGISSGANVFAALRLAEREENRGKLIVAIICDTGERYLSTGLFGSIDSSE